MVPRTSPREVGLRGEVSHGHLPFGSVVPVPHGWQPGDRKPRGRDVSQQPLSGGDKLCSPTLPSISPTADSTDLVQTALIGLPLVFVGLGKCRVLCLQDVGRGQKEGYRTILPSGQTLGKGGKESTNYAPAHLLVPDGFCHGEVYRDGLRALEGRAQMSGFL